MTKTSRKPHVAKDPRFNGMALIYNALCFHKTENDRFQSNSGGVFLTQGIFQKLSGFYLISDLIE